MPRASHTHQPRMRRLLAAFAGVLMATTGIVALAPPQSAEAALTSLPPGFLDEAVVSGLPFPTAVAFTPTGDMFVALKGGQVRVVDNDQLLDEPFLDISAVVHDNDDRGLLGITVHPQFPAEPYIYLAYTYDPPGTAPDQGWPVAGRVARVERFTADAAADYQKVVEGSGLVLVGTQSIRENIGNENDGRDQASVSCMTGGTLEGTPIDDCLASDENSHTIGTVAFGTDGSMFVTNGDGANYNSVDPRALLAQNIDSLSGKVLRIDPDTGLGLPDNPYFDASNPGSNRSKVWSYGLRNPFRMAIEPTSGAPWVGDVGWGAWEEINTGKGVNFGWPCYEGAAVTGSASGSTHSRVQGTYSTNLDTATACSSLYAEGTAQVTAPRYSYDHSGGGASANAGTFYSGAYYPEQYQGALFIADYDRRFIRALTFDESGAVDETINFATETGEGSGPVQLITGPDTNIYWVKYSSDGGEVRRIRYVGEGNVPPVAQATSSVVGGVAPLEVQFSALTSYDPDATPLRYTWDFADGSPTTTEAEPRHTFTNSGIYEVNLTVTEDVAGGISTQTTVLITVGSDPPLATIGPLPDSYAVGDIIEFTGTASALDEPIPGSEHSWQLRLGHNEHVHFATPSWHVSASDPNKTVGTFEVDEHGDNTWYELCLTVKAPSGLTDSVCEMLSPRRVEHTVTTTPVGMSVSYEDEGLQVQGPATIRPIVGSTQTLSVPAVQNSRTFVGWSDGLTDRSRAFTVGETGQTFSAVYENRAPTAQIDVTSALTGSAPLTVTATASGSDPEGDELHYEWTVGTVVVGTGASPELTFSTPGDYDVLMTASDSLGAIATDSFLVSVGAGSGIDDVTYVSALTLGETTNGWGPVELDTTNGGEAAGDGQPITVAGVAFERGLGVHANSSVPVVLPTGVCTQFGATLAVDDTVGANGSVVFTVLADGTPIYTSPTVVGGAGGIPIILDVTGVTTLTLQVGDSGDNTWWDHAVWADARLGCNGHLLGELDPPVEEPEEPALPYEASGSIATGNRTHSVTTADLNGDGLLDVIAAVPGLDAIAVSVASAPGEFGAVTHLSTGPGTFPKYAEPVDVNGDGILDIVSANQDSLDGTDVSVFIGAGDGTFAAAVSYAACERPHEVEVADFDGDGVVDIAVACWGGDDLGLLRGNGDGTFGAATMFAAGNAAHSLEAHDFNGDGALDLAVAAYGSNRVSILINDGAGSFAAPVMYWSGLGPHNIQLADINADGIVDLVMTAEYDNSIGILRGQAGGTFADAVFYSVGGSPKASAIADLNGDGLLDIVTANTHGNYPNGSEPTTLSVLYGTGDMTFSAPVAMPAPLTPFAVAVADVYGDGLPAILSANWHSGDVTLFRPVW